MLIAVHEGFGHWGIWPQKNENKICSLVLVQCFLAWLFTMRSRVGILINCCTSMQGIVKIGNKCFLHILAKITSCTNYVFVIFSLNTFKNGQSKMINDLINCIRGLLRAAAISRECDRREMQPMPEKLCLIEHKRARGRFLHKYFATTPLHILAHWTTATIIGEWVLL